MLFCENLGVLNEVIPFDRVKLFEIFELRDTGIVILFPNDLAQAQQDLLGIMRNQDRKRRHGIYGQRFGYSGRKGRCEERDAPLGLSTCGEKVAFESFAVVIREKWRGTEGTTAVR